VRSIYANWERGDFSAVDWAHPEIVFESTGFDFRTASGVAEMGQRWSEWMSAWEHYRTEAEEIRELGDGRVLVLMWHCGRGKASGVGIDEMKTPGANVFAFQDRKVVRLSLYWDRPDALADLDLEE
jgi:hypothetical protein